jgi:flagellar hook-basal body complex protein FliE
MMEIGAIAPLGLETGGPAVTRLGLDPAALPTPVQPTSPSFASVLENGIAAVDQKMATANDLVRQFALDDNVPLHRVTMALEEAKLSLELAMQVRQRLVESYREIMNMQL